MLQNAHGPVPIATVAFKKEMIPWLCTSIAIASPLRNQAKRKKELRKVTKKSSAEKEPQDLQELFSDFSFNWFCLLFAELLRSIFQ